MATLSASRRNSSNSNPNTPRQSLSGTVTVTSMPRMSSLTEQDKLAIVNCDNMNSNNRNLKTDENVLPDSDQITDSYVPIKVLQDIKNENAKAYRTRACSERSDSGISDCSSHLTSSSCTSTPLLGKKFRINEEETENCENSNNLTLVLNSRNTLSLERRQSHDSDADKIIEEDETDKMCEQAKITNILSMDNRLSPDKNLEGKPPLNVKISEKIGTFNGSKPTKSKYSISTNTSIFIVLFRFVFD